MRPAVVSGIATGTVTVPEVSAKVNSAQFTSRSLERWRHFTTTTRIRFIFPFIFKFGNPSEV